MKLVTAKVECLVHDSFRVQQVAGMFDLPRAERVGERFDVELPGDDESWKIGAIVGPSGSGKTTIAREAFQGAVYDGGDWPADRAVVDGFGELSIRQITGMLTSVRFSSPPAWVKPYCVLSNGEQFRCDLAKALLTGKHETVVFDEFTSVVDRTVARVGSAAVARAVRAEHFQRRFVAVTCHYDVLDWIEPDWVLDMADGELKRRRLRRPPVELRLFRCRRDAWRMFKRHHYLSGELNRAAECYLALWNDSPVAFCAVLNLIGRKGRKRISRIVVPPDYQGLGIGGKVIAEVAEVYLRRGCRTNIVTSHPSMIASLNRSPRWRAVGYRPTGHAADTRVAAKHRRGSLGRAVASFEYKHEAPASVWTKRPAEVCCERRS